MAVQTTVSHLIRDSLAYKTDIFYCQQYHTSNYSRPPTRYSLSHSMTSTQLCHGAWIRFDHWSNKSSKSALQYLTTGSQPKALLSPEQEKTVGLFQCPHITQHLSYLNRHTVHRIIPSTKQKCLDTQPAKGCTSNPPPILADRSNVLSLSFHYNINLPKPGKTVFRKVTSISFPRSTG